MALLPCCCRAASLRRCAAAGSWPPPFCGGSQRRGRPSWRCPTAPRSMRSACGRCFWRAPPPGECCWLGLAVLGACWGLWNQLLSDTALSTELYGPGNCSRPCRLLSQTHPTLLHPKPQHCASAPHPCRLVKLDLGLCGRGMTDDTAAAFGGVCGSYPAATELRLSGAYRLSDQVAPRFP
jgi:hypothetical protein